jgi:2-desacetyl-2-hydroxyethyl bacteriochlorophyllide A dehydrogenase
MKGLVFHGAKDVRFETVPDPGPVDVRGAVLRVERAAICGSDLHLYHGAMPPSAEPFVIGHEFVGEVVEVGSQVRHFRTGDRVLCSGVIGCGECERCARGEVGACDRYGMRVFGMGTALPGGQAQAVAVPVADHSLLAIPEGVSTEQAVLLTDILPTGYFGARGAEIRPGHTVAVIGLGPVGQLALECAWLFGPSKVLAIDRVPERLERARSAGAIPIAADADVEARVREATGGIGPDAVIEAVGADETIGLALRLVRNSGVVSVIGVNFNLAFPFPMGLAMMKNVTFKIGVCPVPELWHSLVPLVRAGRLHPERVFTHRLPLARGAEAYEMFDQKKEGVLKVLLEP